ncbi:MAG: hypothetical protein ABI895_14355 [Deltaproteobacteria bacterium]
MNASFTGPPAAATLEESEAATTHPAMTAATANLSWDFMFLALILFGLDG